MKIRLRIFFVLLVFSLSLNGSNENSMIAAGDDDQLSPIVCAENPQKQSVDCTMPQLLSVNPDSLSVGSCVESRNSSKTQCQEKTVSGKTETSSEQKKITMIKLLIRWITLLLELS